MPADNEMETVSKEWLQSELRAAGTAMGGDLIVLDCRSSNDYAESHVRSAVNFSIPTIMLRRLNAGKIDLTSTIKCRDLKSRILNGLNGDSQFVLYNDEGGATAMDCAGGSFPKSTSNNNGDIINVLHRRLKEDGCRVAVLEGRLNYWF